MSSNGALPLTAVRARAATALAPAGPDDPTVLADPVDAVHPPVLLLEWSDPWLTMETLAGGLGVFTAQLNVLCVASRVEPGPGVATLEQLAAYTLGRLQADAYSWPLANALAPRQFELSGIPLLAARLSFRPRISVEEVP